jgi:hypothetical protein
LYYDTSTIKVLTGTENFSDGEGKGDDEILRVFVGAGTSLCPPRERANQEAQLFEVE